MKNLKRLALSLTLMSALSVTAFAGETSSPPCVPGEIQSPPCVAQSVNDESAALGETNSPPAEPMVDVTDITEAVMWALLLF
jgi:hypothetical protein